MSSLLMSEQEATDASAGVLAFAAASTLVPGFLRSFRKQYVGQSYYFSNAFHNVLKIR